MKERKLRINFIDVLILLVIAAVIFALLYVFVLSGNKNETTIDNHYATLRFVVQAVGVDEDFADNVQIGDKVEEAVARKQLGKVVGVQAEPFQKITFDYGTETETVSVAEGKVTMNVTIEVTAIETDSEFSVDGASIRVGQLYSLALPNIYLSGYCIELSKIED